MNKRHGVVISKTGLIIGLLSLSLVATAGMAQAAIQCYDCHGDRATSTLKPKDTYLTTPAVSQRDTATGAFLGNHGTHLGNSPVAGDCVKCHNNTGYTSSHAANFLGTNVIRINPKLNNYSSSLGRARYGKPTFFNQTSMPVTATCSNVNCHFVSKPTDTWGTAPYATSDITTCGKCHDALPATNAHTLHISKYGNNLASCATCHTDHTAEAKPFQHATSVGRAITIKNTYTGSNNLYLPGQSGRTVGQCSNVYCHSSGQSLASGTVATPTYKAVSWSTSGSSCSAELCHPTQKASTTSGSHTKHLAPASAACVNCHTGVATDGSTYTSALHVDQSISVDSALTYTAGGAPGNGYGTCSTTTCHANVYGTGSMVTPAWGSTGNGCSACHTTAIATTGPATGSHAKHNNTNCGACHAGATDSATVPSANHGNNVIDVTGGYPVTAKHTAGTYTGTCSTATCHANVYGTGTVTTPVWGDTTKGCASCHSVAMNTYGPNTGSHLKHAGAACTACHAAGTAYNAVPTTGHNDNNITVTVGGYPTTVAKHPAGSGYSSCSNITCHSGNGAISAVSAVWGASLNCKGCHATLSAGHTAHISTLFEDRASTMAYTNYTANVTSDSAYKFGCANCHPVVLSKHLNNVVDVDLATAAASGTLKAKNPTSPLPTYNGTKQCLNIYCHSNGFDTNKVYATTPAWGGTIAGDKCAACHGNSPNGATQIAGSPAHVSHSVGIHFDDIYNGVSGKLTVGNGAGNVAVSHGSTTQGTTISCNICHFLTVGDANNDKGSECSSCHTATPKGTPTIKRAAHVNGSVNVSFASMNIKSKAQIRPESFDSYTAVWARTTYKVDGASIDTAKKSLSQASFTAGTAGQGSCATVACHNGYTVKWNDSLTCESCHSRL